MSGLLDLALALGLDGRTRPIRALARPPIQLSRVRYDDVDRPDRAVFTLLTLGGVLAGDRNVLAVTLAAGAAGRIRMAAATQVLAMPEGDAEQRLEVRLGPGSSLEWLAEPTILFARASLSQRTHVWLAPGATLMLVDVLAPGRLARGEIHRYTHFQFDLEVCDPDGRLLLAEYGELTPAERPPDIAGVLGTAPVVGSLYLLGDTVDGERLAAQAGAMRIPCLGATSLPNNSGLLLRALGHTPSAVRALLIETLALLSG